MNIKIIKQTTTGIKERKTEAALALMENTFLSVEVFDCFPFQAVAVANSMALARVPQQRDR